MREWLARIFDWMQRSRLDAELQEELRFHQAHLERRAIRVDPNTVLRADW
jgi:hypothetical protein